MSTPTVVISSVPVVAGKPIVIRLRMVPLVLEGVTLSLKVDGTPTSFSWCGSGSQTEHAFRLGPPVKGEITGWGMARLGALVEVTVRSEKDTDSDQARVARTATSQALLNSAQTSISHTRPAAGRFGARDGDAGYRIAGLGWLPDPPDHRDMVVRTAKVVARLSQVLPRTARGVRAETGGVSPVGPLASDLRRWCAPIEDQGDVGSCTANAVIGALEYFQRKTAGIHVDASRLFLYRVTRRFLGWQGRGDTGAFLRTTMKALALFGALPERYWRYDRDDWDAEPDAFAYAYAQSFKALEYFRLEPDIHQLKSSLDSGLPFVFGFSCFKSIGDPAVVATGIIPYPDVRERIVGGHAVLAVGYSDTHVLFRNSWGEYWGDAGYGYLPWSYFDSAAPLADDCWVLVNADWVADDEADADLEEAFEVAAVLATPSDRAAVPAYMTITRGDDPVRHVPLQLTATGVIPQAPNQSNALARTAHPVGLVLRSVTLNENFDWALFGDANNEIFVRAVAWDLSGAPPIVWPPSEAQLVPGQSAMRKGDTWQFIGDGLTLWPDRPIVGALYLRLALMESDNSDDALDTLARLTDAVADSKLATELPGLLTEPTAATLQSISVAASGLSAIIVAALRANGDDVVALFEGSWATTSLAKTSDARYEQRGASVAIHVRVSGGAEDGG